MQIKKAVSLSLATLVVVVLMIATRKRHQVRKPHQERDEFHFVVKAAEWDLRETKVCMFFGSGLSTPLVTTVGCWDKQGIHDFFNQDGVMFLQTQFGSSGYSGTRGWDANPYEPQLNMALQKRFHLSEPFTLQFRAEAFNLTNTPIFPGPSTDIFTPPHQLSNGSWIGLGTVPYNQQNFPRNIQFSLKLLF